MFFISSEKVFLSLIYLHFRPDFFGCVKKRFDNKAKVNFKIHDIANWNSNSYNKDIVRYLIK